MSTAMSYNHQHVHNDDTSSDTDSSDRYTEMSWDFPSVASSRTSYDVSMRSASPTPSVVSVTSSFRAQAFRTEYGRGLNNYSEVYTLPADDEEIDRLNNQYLMFNEVIGKYPPPLPEVLAEDNLGGVPGEIKAVLDLGCGSGCWIMDIARQFPHCSAVAVDLVPMQSPDMPPNCRSEVDDINLGLEHFYGDFDVVHVQLVSSGIRDYQGLIDHISHVLRPGGLMELIEFPFAFTGADHVNIVRGPGEYGPPWAAQWMATARQAVMQRGGEADASGHLRQWVEDHPAFENVVYREYWFPCSPWLRGNDPQSAKWNRIGATMRDDIVAFMKGGRPLLLRSGLSEAFVDDLQTKAVNELMEGKEPVFVCIQNIYARKKTT